MKAKMTTSELKQYVIAEATKLMKIEVLKEEKSKIEKQLNEVDDFEKNSREVEYGINPYGHEDKYLNETDGLIQAISIHNKTNPIFKIDELGPGRTDAGGIGVIFNYSQKWSDRKVPEVLATMINNKLSIEDAINDVENHNKIDREKGRLMGGDTSVVHRLDREHVEGLHNLIKFINTHKSSSTKYKFSPIMFYPGGGTSVFKIWEDKK